MRKFTYVSTFLFIFSAAQASAKVWVVNANGTGNFTTLTAAIDSAASGDTLFVAPGGYVESPSATSKTLTVLGIGFSSDSATTWSIILNSPLALGAGSVVSGLELRGIANPAMINVNSPSTVVEKCHIAANGHDGIDVTADSCVVRQNVFENILPTTANGVTVTGSHLGITILNNVISNFNNGIMLNNGGDEIVANNAIFFAYNAAVSFGSGTFTGKIFSNIFDEDNIAIAATSPPYYCGYNDYWQDPYGGTPSFDVGSISSNPEFVNYSSTTGYVYGTSNLHLAAGSPCIDAGEPNVGNNDRDGSRNDMGIYGGPEMFDDTGTPIYPCVITVAVSPYAAPLNGTITIKVLGRIGQ
jgi:hypothetical protein